MKRQEREGDEFGSIYDAYGIETLFDCVKHPLKAAEYFRQIVADIKAGNASH